MLLDFASGRIRVEVFEAYVSIEHGGPLAGAGEVTLYRIAIANVATEARVTQSLIHLRAPHDWLESAAGAPWWSWLADRRVFVRAAVLVDDPAFALRFRRQLVELGTRVTVHDDVAKARAWLIDGLPASGRASAAPARPSASPRPIASPRPSASEPEIVIQTAGDEE